MSTAIIYKKHMRTLGREEVTENISGVFEKAGHESKNGGKGKRSSKEKSSKAKRSRRSAIASRPSSLVSRPLSPVSNQSSEKDSNNGTDSFQSEDENLLMIFEGDEIKEYELDENQQYERINLLLLGIATLFLLNANVLLVCWIRGNVDEKIVLSKNIIVETKVTSGMPIPQLAAYGDAGYVEAFSILQERTVKDFPNLPHGQSPVEGFAYDQSAWSYYQMFVATYQNMVYFLSCNPAKKVTKVDVDNYGNYQTIDKSNIKNEHYLVAKGVQVGKYFWILGGYLVSYNGVPNFEDENVFTSIWVLNKEYWINGPELPSFFIADFYHAFTCLSALNSTSVLFISKDNFIFYNFEVDKWYVRDNPLDFEYQCTCGSAFDKNYARQLYFLYGWPVLKLIQWNLELDSLQNEFTVIPENFSTTEMMNWNKTVQFYGRAQLATLSETIFLIDGINTLSGKIQPVYELTRLGIVTNTKLYMFLNEYEEASDEIYDYYDIVKTFVYMKRNFKTVQKVFY